MNKQSKTASGTSNRQTFIGFAPPLLGAQPVRLPVLGCAEGLLALNLPGGIAADADPLNPPNTPLVAQGVREQIAAGKPELTRLGIKAVQSIFNLEPEMSGIALFGVNKQGAEFWRNAYGSELLRLRFLLICEPAPDLPDSLECALPIARHRDGGQMLVSHKSGKKTTTRFRRLAVSNQPKGKHNPLLGKELWEATCTYLRPHQIRLHAYEIGLRVCGESLYTKVPSFYLSELKGLRRPPAGEAVLWPAPMVHLAGIEPVDATASATFRKANPVAPAALKEANPAAPAATGSAPAALPSESEASVMPVPDTIASVMPVSVSPVSDTSAAEPASPSVAAQALHWPLSASLPRPLALATRLLFDGIDHPA